MKYVCELVNLSERTVVYQVKTETGKFVAQFPYTKPRAAESFARYLTEKKIVTIKEWLEQPYRVQLDFVFATSDERPILPVV